MARVPGVGLLNRTCKSWVERHEVQFLRGLPTIRNGCVAQTELEQASHKREVGGSTPPTATKFLRAGDVTESIEVLQTSCEGLNPSQSTKLRCSSIANRARLVNEGVRGRVSSPQPDSAFVA